MFIILTISVFGQTSGQKSDKETKTEKEVKELTNQFVDALKKKDTIALERLLSDEYVDIGLFSEMFTTKSLLMRIFKESPKASFETFTVDVEKSSIHIYDNTAIMLVTAKGIWNVDKSENLDYLGTLVAVKRNERWQFAATHFSKFKLQVSPAK